MDKGYIRITENDRHEFSVEAKLINGTLWLSQWEMATLFNVYTKTIEGSLKAIFKAKLLWENEVSRTYTFVNNGKESLQTLYNLEALIFVSYRIASCETRAFREWLMKAFTEYTRTKFQRKEYSALIVYNLSSKLPSISLN